MSLHVVTSDEQFVSRERMAEIMGITVRSFDELRARGQRYGIPCPCDSWGLRRVLFEPARVIPWARSLGDREAA